MNYIRIKILVPHHPFHFLCLFFFPFKRCKPAVLITFMLLCLISLKYCLDPHYWMKFLVTFFFFKKADINPIFSPIKILTSMNISCKKGFSFTPIIKESFLQSVVNILHVFSRGLSPSFVSPSFMLIYKMHFL